MHEMWDRDPERYRTPDERKSRCPVCGKKCNYIYRADGEPVGCEKCIEVIRSEDLTQRGNGQ